jgi:hypothetical protein
VAEFPARAGASRAAALVNTRAMFVAHLSNGMLCVSDAKVDGTNGAGGCNPGSRPLDGHAIEATLTYDGGPSVASVTDARLFGLAASSVNRAEALMNDGSPRALALTSNGVAATDLRAFAYRLDPTDLANGVTPVAVLSYGAGGRLLDRQPTGFQG